MTTQKKPSLYEIGVEGAEIEQILIEGDGELTPELEQRLDAHLKLGKDKVVAAVMVVRNLEASEDACNKEKKRVADREKSFGRQIDSLKARILFAVDEGFSGKVKTDLFTIWGQNSKQTVGFDLSPGISVDAFAKAYPSLVKTTIELDRAAIAALRESGAEMPESITLVEGGGNRFLQIR